MIPINVNGFSLLHYYYIIDVILTIIYLQIIKTTLCVSVYSIVFLYIQKSVAIELKIHSIYTSHILSFIKN